MNFLEVDLNESTSLNTSITIHPPIPESEAQPNETSQTQQQPETQNTSVQNQNLAHYLSQCEGGSVAPKSNYSSINNILPCPDSDRNRLKRDDNTQKPAEKSQFSNTMPVSSGRNPELAAMRQKINLESLRTSSDKPVIKNNSRPPLNPTEVAKGLSALHMKVDELLRKKSQPRGRDSSTDSERPQRAFSTDARPDSKITQPFSLNSFQREASSNLDILSGRTCHSIDIGGAFANSEDVKDIMSQVKNLKTQQTNICQDLSLKEKTVSNPVKVSSPPKPKYHINAKLPSYTTAVKPSFTIEALKHNSTQLSQRVTEESFHSQYQETNAKPKYDESKLNAIISRIRERNSVSPGPGQRAVTETESGPVSRFSVTSHNNSFHINRKTQESLGVRKETKLDERNTSVCSNWQLSTLPIGDILNEKELNMTGNTTILELTDKKRSFSSPKFRDSQIGENKKNTSYLNRPSGTIDESLSLLQDRKPVHAVSDKNTTSLTSYSVQDLIKDLKNRKPSAFKEQQQRCTTESLQTSESFLERTRKIIASDYQPRASNLSLNLGTYKDGYNLLKTQEGTNKRGREMLNNDSIVQKDSSSCLFGGLENDMDSLMENLALAKETDKQRLQQYQRGVINTELDQEVRRIHTTEVQGHHYGSSRGRDSQTHSTKKSVDKTEKINNNRDAQENAFHFNKQDLINKLNVERERLFDADKRSRNGSDRTTKNLLEEQSPIKRVEDDSLLMDESVFSIKDGALTGEINTNRLFTNTDRQERQSKKPKVCNRTELCNTEIRKKYLQDDQDISDFDFERNKLEPTERDLSKEVLTGFKDEYGSKYGAKRQKVEERRSSSIGYSEEKMTPKTELPRRGIVGRAVY